MNRTICIFALVVLPAVGSAQDKVPPRSSAKSFPNPDFVLRDTGSQPQKNGLVLGPMESDGKGGSKGSFAIYGGTAAIRVASLSLSGDGKILAVGSRQPRVDILGRR